MNKDLYTSLLFRSLKWSVLLFTLCLISCQDDKEEYDAPYFRIENASVSSKANILHSSELGFTIAPLIGDETLELMCYDIRTNRKWTAEVSSSDKEWLYIWPVKGSGDSKVRFCAIDNDSPLSRSTTVIFHYDDGFQTEVTLLAEQESNEPYIRVYADNQAAESISAGHHSQTNIITVKSNIDFFYKHGTPDWMTFTETSNGEFTLQINEYPIAPSELERYDNVRFTGVGIYSHITASLDVLQSIRPYISISGEDIDSNGSFPPFSASSPDVTTFKLISNYDWSITSDDTWFRITPSSGVAYQEYNVTIHMDKNTADERIGVATITTSEILGVKDVLELSLYQESGTSGGSSPMEGLDNPVKWFFNGASGDYSTQIEQFEVNNNLRASTGVGSLSFTHTYLDASGNIPEECTRRIGASGHPYVTGAWPGDYWIFEVPVRNFKSGTKVKFTGCFRASNTGQKYWMFEFLDNGIWKNVSELKTVTVNGEQVTYTHEASTSYENEITFIADHKYPIADGNIMFRMTCMANWTMGNAALEKPNGGTIRWAANEANGYNDSPVIEVVQ